MRAERKLGRQGLEVSALGRGFLTGAARRAEEYPEGDYRKGEPRYQGDKYDANIRAASTVRDLARRKGATPGQVALAWLLNKGDDIVSIPGTKRRTFLEENPGALDLALAAEDMAVLEALLPEGRASGERYAPHMPRWIDH